jgi:DNA polymerase
VSRALSEVAIEASTCTKCRLADGRTQVVFGVGDPHADLLFVGEAPGMHEDKQGEPFVGAAGQLLTRMLGEIGLTREQVYIANVLKCRPPGNRDPQEDEIETCTPWLVEQISLIQPAVVAAGQLRDEVCAADAAGHHTDAHSVAPWPRAILTFHPLRILHGGGEKSRQFGSCRRTSCRSSARSPSRNLPRPAPTPCRPDVARRAGARYEPVVPTTS